MNQQNSRQEMLNRDLIEYNPGLWRLNIPFVNYTLRVEDFIPAISGAIGKVALVAAFIVAWAKGFGIDDPLFVTENIRLEIILGSLFTILFCALLNPYAAPPGTLAPLIPIVPLMAGAGVHPLPLGLLIGFIGIVISGFKYFDKIIQINGPGSKGGIILLFGILGTISSLDNLKKWTDTNDAGLLLVVLIVAGLLIYLALNRMKARWLVIPLCAVAALGLSAMFGLLPELKTPVSLPLLNPSVWWNEKWGIGWGLNIDNFIKALPFALLAVVMWPTDAVAIRTLQEANYPKEAQKAIFSMDATFIVASLRNIAGVFMGGAQTSAIWRSFMIPLATVKRPIGGSALLLGITGLVFGISGMPLDIAVFSPLIWLVLIFGVYVPLIEVGLDTVKSMDTAMVAVICLVVGMALNPVLGWVAAITVENFSLMKKGEGAQIASKGTRITTVVVLVITITSFVLANISL